MRTELVGPRPFVKWAGGKTQLLGDLRRVVPKGWDPDRDLYFEPFVGGGALFFELGARRAYLNDACSDLMGAWRVVMHDVGGLVRRLSEMAVEYVAKPEATYYRVRDCDDLQSDVERAARFVFLNKTCFNGLQRTNKQGRFNVSWGKNPKAVVLDEENLRACSEHLRRRDVTLGCRPFDDYLKYLVDTCGDVFKRALVYLDPPFVPRSKTACFTKYVSTGFNYADQLALAALASKIRDLGAHVVVSTSDDERLVGQYRELSFKVVAVRSRRRISATVGGRAEVVEHVMVGGRG